MGVGSIGGWREESTSQRSRRLNGTSGLKSLLARKDHLDRILPLHELGPACPTRQYLTSPPPVSYSFSHPIPSQTNSRTDYLQKLTPISALAAEILAGVRHQHHGQDELELLQRLLPFLLGVRVGVVRGGVDVVAGGGVGEGVDFGGGGGGGWGGGVVGVDVLGGGGGGGGGHFGGGKGWWRGSLLGGGWDGHG